MPSNERINQEAVGTNFSALAMLHARHQTFVALERIAAGIRPGMNQQQAGELAQSTLLQMGMDHLWHPSLVRLGANTLKTFDEAGDPQQVLAENDIFFIDLGVVWDGHEGDFGDSFVVGDDVEMQACADAARSLWQQVSQYWSEQRVSGQELYRYAHERAQAAGWRLYAQVSGHRLGDFPHARHHAGSLAQWPTLPASGLWVLDIQIAHPSRAFGAFYEDLLL
jgi:Xaa-Pro aminopeptidase